MSQIALAFHRISPPVFHPTADVPSFTLPTALSAIPSVSERGGVEVRSFHDKSSQDLPNSDEMSLHK